MSKLAKRLLPFFIIIICFLLYGNSLQNGYNLDDEYVIANNPRTEKGIAAIPEIFTQRYAQTADQHYGYRPITSASFAIEYEFFGANPFVSHFINILLYAFTCILLFHILSLLFKEYNWLLPLIITTLFLVHPIHTEVVNNVKSRDELLCFLFALLALKMFFHFSQKNKWIHLLAGFLLLVVSLLSKLSSLPFLVIIPLSLYYFGNLKGKKLVLVTILPVASFIGMKLTTAMLLTRNEFPRTQQFFENPLFEMQGGILTSIPAAFFSIGYYIKLLFIPHPLISYYGYNHVPIVGWGDYRTWISIFVVLLLAGLVLWKLKTKKVWVFGIAYFLISISMFSNLVKPNAGIIAERLSYIASLGFCIVLGYSLFMLFNKRNNTKVKKYIFYSISFLIVGVSILKTTDRNTHWKDKSTLFSHDLTHAPNSVKLNMLLADLDYSKLNQLNFPKDESRLFTNAVNRYNKAISIHPQHGLNHLNLGVLYNNMTNYQKGEVHIQKGIDLGEKTADAYFNLGASQEMTQQLSKASENYRRSIAHDSTYYTSYPRLIKVESELGNLEECFALNLLTLSKFQGNARELMKQGQFIANNNYGPGNTYYIDLLLRQNFIDVTTHQRFKNELEQTNTFTF